MQAERLRQNPDALELWGQVGLEELRLALDDVKVSMRRFEQSLQAMPPGDAYPHPSWLEDVQRTGTRLGREVVSLAVLAEILKEAVVTAEQTQVEFAPSLTEPDSSTQRDEESEFCRRFGLHSQTEKVSPKRRW